MFQVWGIDQRVQSFTPHYKPETYERKEGTPFIHFYCASKQHDINNILALTVNLSKSGKVLS